ncbi:VRR-NUC domain-containing protein [Janthinobacterium sp.]|uniref:VRR-NUC domain-containing protein n=1 Tax=Janthinobacterium sp. TaxID=1871054 RepID=UPI0025BB0456|nr:VRR-NUC domain-containing protein [Janthinobacterium sp.]NBV20342.1 VRR-NUC domain-containing protein [Janthinobacterium sp.]
MSGPEHRLQLRVMKFVASAVTAPHRFASHDRGQNNYGKSGVGRHFWERQRGVKAGEPDTSLTVGGKTIHVELKAPGGKLSDAQKKEGAAIQAAGGIWAWTTSVMGYGEILSANAVPMAANWPIQAAHHDAMLEAAKAKVPAPKKARKPRAAKPSASRIARAVALQLKYLP